MLLHNWLNERIHDWVQEYQLSGWEAGWGASQQETPRTREFGVDMSFATWNNALLMPQWQRAESEA